MFKAIIWATDGSSGAERALPFAKGLAQGAGARLVVVHVKELAVEPGRRIAGHRRMRARSRPRSRKQVEDLKQEGLDATLQSGGAWR